MAAAILLGNIFFMSLPLLINKYEDSYQEEYTINPEQLFFIEYESDYSFVPWKDLIKVVGMIVLVCYSYYEMMQIRLEIDEIQTVEDQLTVNHEEVMAIESFYKDAEQQFTTLEKQSTGLQKRFTKADILSKQNKEFEKIKEDIDFVQSSWFAQYSSFGLLDVSLKETSICDREVMVQLTEIKALFDKELEKIESYMDEDLMALDRVLRGATQHMSWADMMEMYIDYIQTSCHLKGPRTEYDNFDCEYIIFAFVLDASL